MFITQDFVFLSSYVSFDSISIAHFYLRIKFCHDFTWLHSTGLELGDLYQLSTANKRGRQRCSNSLIGRAGVRLAFHLHPLAIMVLPGLVRGNLLLP